MKLTRVRTMEELKLLADLRRSVWYENFKRPIPAVVMLNMQAALVLRFIQSGVYEWKPQRSFFSGESICRAKPTALTATTKSTP